MKKGFTLVEMSIVLVIIGILMGMTVKGKQLIDSAKLRSDIAVIRNIQTQYNAYRADNNGKVPDDFSVNKLIPLYLQNSDLKMKLAKKDVAVSQVVLANDNNSYAKATKGSSIAVILEKDDIVLGCKIDATIDDSNPSNGVVRNYVDGKEKTSTKTAKVEFTDCKTGTTTMADQYAVLID